ncbi:MAG: gfo/Idh/MocA family oxidoreductase [Planctomycetota bacterium]|nr:MAG: gfo/Idh/MocA family oxidoreductase [Planctomycetota bacterium]
MASSLSRRLLLRAAASAGPALFTLSLGGRRVLGANDRLDIGIIGVGGRGGANLDAVAGENIVALCDVDEQRLTAAGGRFPAAERFADYRAMLAEAKLDAVVISTPDHHHAPATVRALQRGLHVYCEKPLTHTVAEARLVAKIAAQKGVATQMGTQNHEHPGYLRLVELLRAGAIGQVSDVHVITDRPGTWWPQGIEAPQGGQPVPSDLNWDLWLGPAANRAYDPAYVPFKWRGWWDFGCGAVGDMAIHLADPAFWGLNLAGPVRVSSQGPAPNPDSAPTWMQTTYEFAARGKRGPVKLHWYEGETKAPVGVAADLPMNGSLFVGTQGRIAIAHDGLPRLLPEEQFKDFVPPPPSLLESPGHHRQWIEACKTGSRTGSPFSYAAPFTETVLLGSVAYRAGVPIEYDPATGLVTNDQAANGWLSKEYRKGFEVSESPV